MCSDVRGLRSDIQIWMSVLIIISAIGGVPCRNLARPILFARVENLIM